MPSKIRIGINYLSEAGGLQFTFLHDSKFTKFPKDLQCILSDVRHVATFISKSLQSCDHLLG
jgi:hypothetical protein